MKDFKFTKENLLFLKGIKEKGTVTNQEALIVEAIYKRMDENYSMCTTCSSIISAETRRLINISEAIKNDLFNKEDFKGATAKNIVKIVLELKGIKLKTKINNKAKLIIEALKILNK